MNRAVLDSSILLKSIFKPLRSLSNEVYARELETHSKCRMLLRLLDEREVEVCIPIAMHCGDCCGGKKALQQVYGEKDFPGNNGVLRGYR